MIEIRQLRDAKLIAEAMTHPRVWPWITDGDNGSAVPADFAPLMGDGVCYAGVYQGDEYLGLWMFLRVTSAKWEVHTCLLPKAWGRIAVAAASVCLAWFWEKFPDAESLVTMVPSDNALALRFAVKCGFEEWGRNRMAFRRNGKLFDEIWLSQSRSVKHATSSSDGRRESSYQLAG